MLTLRSIPAHPNHSIAGVLDTGNFGHIAADYLLEKRELAGGEPLIVMALSGLVITYTEPITGLLYAGTTRVVAEGQALLSLSAQQNAADRAAPNGASLFRVVTPITD